jgi:hypothetical protein
MMILEETDLQGVLQNHTSRGGKGISGRDLIHVEGRVIGKVNPRKETVEIEDEKEEKKIAVQDQKSDTKVDKLIRITKV